MTDAARGAGAGSKEVEIPVWDRTGWGNRQMLDAFLPRIKGYIDPEVTDEMLLLGLRLAINDLLPRKSALAGPESPAEHIRNALQLLNLPCELMLVRHEWQELRSEEDLRAARARLARALAALGGNNEKN